MNVSEILGQSRCFRGVDKNQLRPLLDGVEVRAFQRNQALWRDVDHSSRLAFVASGRIKLVRHRASGKDLIIDILGPGQMVDFALDDGDDEPASVIGLAQGTVVIIDSRTFLSRVRSSPDLAINLVLNLAREKTALLARFDEISAGSVEARLASLFMRFSTQEGVEFKDGIHIDLPLSRQDLADLVDTTIETAIRVMSRWNRESLVITKRDGFIIADIEALEMLMEPDA